jgi:hypothetical protein
MYDEAGPRRPMRWFDSMSINQQRKRKRERERERDTGCP